MKWWKRLFRTWQCKTYAPMAVDLETGRVFVWAGSTMIDTGVTLGVLGRSRF